MRSIAASKLGFTLGKSPYIFSLKANLVEYPGSELDEYRDLRTFLFNQKDTLKQIDFCQIYKSKSTEEILNIDEDIYHYCINIL